MASFPEIASLYVMIETLSDGGVPATPTATPKHRPDAPVVFLRNEDDIEHSLDVRVIADGHLLAEITRQVAGEDYASIEESWAAPGTVRLELWADHGCAASVSLDRTTPEIAPAPEFIVRSDSVVVAGVN